MHLLGILFTILKAIKELKMGNKIVDEAFEDNVNMIAAYKKKGEQERILNLLETDTPGVVDLGYKYSLN